MTILFPNNEYILYIGAMLSSLDITRILVESSGPLEGAVITAIEFYRKERALQWYIKGKKRHCLTMSYHPRQNGLFIQSAAKARLDTREKPRPFARDLTGATITAIIQQPNDRIVEIQAKADKNLFIFVLEIIGPNGNVWLLDNKRRYIVSLRDKKFKSGDTYQIPSLPDKLDPAGISEDELKKMFEDHPGTNPARLLEKNLYGFDYNLARTVTDGEDAVSDIDPGKIHRRLKQIIDAYRAPGSIYAYRLKDKPAYYPIKIAGYEPLGKFRDLSEAQRQTLTETRESSEAEDFQEKTIKALDKKIKRTEKLLSRLDGDIEEASDYEKYRQFSDLLKISLSKLKRGMNEITVDDLYHAGLKISIPLDPKLNGRQNIEQYARRYRKGKDGLVILTRRRENTEQELETLKEARELFETGFEKAQNRWPEYLPRPAGIGPADVSISRPYKAYETSTGLSVFVGKSGDNNDRTTFEYARPYELWFHTSQCPGSHVVMKFPHKNFEPSKMEIEEVAACAAYFSKARGSAKVAVSYTLKKYVRKPRRAKAGLVTIERETTILVEPRELRKKD